MRVDFITAAAMALLLAGCTSNASRVSALPPAPTGPVTTQQLPPPPNSDMNAQSPMEQQPGQMQAPTAQQPGQPGQMGAPGQPGDAGMAGGQMPNQQVASAPPASSGPPSKESVLGQWSISASGESCQIVVSLTTWQGGHRASTRGCSHARAQEHRRVEHRGQLHRPQGQRRQRARSPRPGRQRLPGPARARRRRVHDALRPRHRMNREAGFAVAFCLAAPSGACRLPELPVHA